jgi:hypothetical protein
MSVRGKIGRVNVPKLSKMAKEFPNPRIEKADCCSKCDRWTRYRLDKVRGGRKRCLFKILPGINLVWHGGCFYAARNTGKR